MKYLFLAMFVVACSSQSVQLTDKAKDLEVYATRPADCRVVGKVIGVDKNGSKELALNDALNQSANLGATGVFVNQEVPNGAVMNVHATAYNCQ